MQMQIYGYLAFVIANMSNIYADLEGHFIILSFMMRNADNSDANLRLSLHYLS